MIDWNENAISAVKEFYRWANLKHRAGCSADTDKFFSELDVNRPTQKTFADAEQEGEKWTHTWNGRKCRVIFTDDYMSWVKGEGLNKLVPTDSLKPIKPTMKKGEREAVARFITRIWSKRNPDLRAEFDAFCDDHDII